MTIIEIKLCKMVVFTNLYYLHHFQLPWFYFKVWAVSDSFNWKCYVLLSWNFVRLLITWSKSSTCHYIRLSYMFTGDNWHASSFEKNNTFDFVFLSDSVKEKSFKLCMIITLLWVYIFIAGLFLILFLDHRCLKNINYKLCVLDSCLDSSLLYS